MALPPRLTRAEQLSAAIGDRIDKGELGPGDRLPSIAELAKTYDVSRATVQAAYQLLKGTGAIESFHGRGTFVREAKPRFVRDAYERYNWEKRRIVGEGELDTLVVQADLNAGELPAKADAEIKITATYDVATVSKTDTELQEIFGVDGGAKLLLRHYTTSIDGRLLVITDSAIPLALIKGNPELLDETKEPWPGGTMAQLRTVGIEVDHIVDQVSSRAPTFWEISEFRLADGVPVFEIGKTSIDLEGRVVEVATSTMPADMTDLRYTTQLERWE